MSILVRILKTMAVHALDNPVWSALSETHISVSLDYNSTKFYHPGNCPFGGTLAPETTAKAIDQYAALTDHFFLVGEKPQLPANLIFKNELICLQMIVDKKTDVEISENIIPLSTQHHDELFELVNLVQPGYFRKETAKLGDYFGIFKNEKLIAVTGERMKMNSFTEVSAVVTHPDHTGKGYAKQLVAHAVNNIFEQNKTPFLHVAESNSHAIQLYEKLGFVTRRKMSFWHITR